MHTTHWPYWHTCKFTSASVIKLTKIHSNIYICYNDKAIHTSSFIFYYKAFKYTAMQSSDTLCTASYRITSLKKSSSILKKKKKKKGIYNDENTNSYFTRKHIMLEEQYGHHISHSPTHPCVAISSDIGGLRDARKIMRATQCEQVPTFQTQTRRGRHISTTPIYH